MYRSQPADNQDVMSLFGAEGELRFVQDEDCRSEEFDLESECSEDSRGSRNIRSSLSLEIHGLQRDRPVYFSNQEYYQRLEELKSAHLKNMAELEKLYLQQEREGHRERDEEHPDLGMRKKSIGGPTRKLMRINSQEELDVHETSSGSDQSELSGGVNIRELLEDRSRRVPRQDLTVCRNLSSLLRTTAPGGRRSGVPKVTVPKPFKMMLREEERKRNKVRTRSEVELENALLRRELEELQECRKKFRASPAPVHIHLPLCEVISRRSKKGKPHDEKGTQPFHFLEREKKKKEARIVAELAVPESKLERAVFKARPMPSAVYGLRHDRTSQSNCRTPQETAAQDLRDPRPGQDAAPLSPQCRRSVKPVKKHIKVSIEMVRGNERPSAGPPELGNTGSPQQPCFPELLRARSGCSDV